MRFYCTDDTVDLEQYPYHVRDVHISDPFILADPLSRCYVSYVLFAVCVGLGVVVWFFFLVCFYCLGSCDLFCYRFYWFSGSKIIQQ